MKNILISSLIGLMLGAYAGYLHGLDVSNLQSGNITLAEFIDAREGR